MLLEGPSLPGAPGSVLAAAISGFSICSQTSSLPSLSAADITCVSPANRGHQWEATLPPVTALVRLQPGLTAPHPVLLQPGLTAPPPSSCYGAGGAPSCVCALTARLCSSGSLCPSLQSLLPFLLVLSDQRGMCRLWQR